MANITYQKPDIIPHLSNFQSFKDLQDNLKLIQSLNPASLFNDINNRKEKYTLNTKNIELDYSLQPINTETITHLCRVAEDLEMHKHIDNLFSGKFVNVSENRPALHTALRANHDEYINLNNQNIIPDVLALRNKTIDIANLIRQNQWFKNPNKKVTDIVNIGIGGSELGPRMAISALKEYINTDIKKHFLSNNDPKYLAAILKKINLESTVFIVNSKSFTTQETISNLESILNLLDESLPVSEHIIAITNNVNLAKRYKIEHILPIYDWIGGRFSFCSSVNLILAVMIGPENFLSILRGAKSMDNNFRNAPFNSNIPLLSALLEIWNINFFKSNSHIFLTYVHFLKYFPEFLQQLGMESSGKSTDLNNSLINYNTSPIIWGGLGSHAEHAYYQLMMQGCHFNTVDYFFSCEQEYNHINSIAIRKINALAKGLGSPDCNRFQLGINIVKLNTLNPESLGALISMYEHKTYSQSVLWNINAFDQPGVSETKRILSLA